MSLENYFPYKPLDQGDIDGLIEFCGGTPIIDPQQLGGFFRHLAGPMLDDSLARPLIDEGARICADIQDTNPKRAEVMFHRGALLYAAVLASCSTLSSIPCIPEVFLDITEADGEEIIYSANVRLHDESPTFCEFMNDMSSALEIYSTVDHRLAGAGAGLVHIVTTESLRLEESRAFELEHPELSDLEQIFRDLSR